MNIAYFLHPKASLAYLYDDSTFRQGLAKMRVHGYAAIPVLTRDGRYAGTVSEGDFLWKLVAESDPGEPAPSVRDLEKLHIRDLLHPDKYPPVPITVTMDELLESAMNQNFTPVVDDLGSFIGIVTRKDVIRYLSGEQASERAELSSL